MSGRSAAPNADRTAPCRSARLLAWTFVIVLGNVAPSLRLTQVGHELGHAVAASLAGFHVTGMVFTSWTSAGVYTSFDPLQATGLHGRVIGVVILSAGYPSGALVTAGVLVAVAGMQSGRLIVAATAASLAGVATFWVPTDGELPSDGSLPPAAGTFTTAYLVLLASILFLVAIWGQRAAKATAYVLAASASIGLLSSVQGLWFPARHPTDADLVASLTATPALLWRVLWTAVVAVVFGVAARHVLRSPSGAVIRDQWRQLCGLFDVTPSARSTEVSRRLPATRFLPGAKRTWRT